MAHQNIDNWAQSHTFKIGICHVGPLMWPLDVIETSQNQEFLYETGLLTFSLPQKFICCISINSCRCHFLSLFAQNYKDIIALDPFSVSTFLVLIMLSAGFFGICIVICRLTLIPHWFASFLVYVRSTSNLHFYILWSPYTPLAKLLAQQERLGTTQDGSGNKAENYSSISATNQHQLRHKICQ